MALQQDSKQGNQLGGMIEQAKELRLQGNHLFRQQYEYQAALGFYTQALELLDNNTKANTTENRDKDTVRQNQEEMILNLCNRSATYYVMEEYEAAKDDAQKAWMDLSSRTSVKVRLQ